MVLCMKIYTCNYISLIKSTGIKFVLSTAMPLRILLPRKLQLI